MDTVYVAGLVAEINSFTPCLQQKDIQHLHLLIKFIIEESEKRFTNGQMNKVVEVMKMSAADHEGQRRDDKVTPYIVHPLEGAVRAFHLDIYDFKFLLSMIRHDAIEDEPNKDKRYRRRKAHSVKFGRTVRDTVELVTKSRLPWKRKLFFVEMFREKRIHIRWRAFLLKAIDCDINLDTYDVFLPEKQKSKAEENIREYVPLCRKLGHDLNKLVQEGKLRAKPYATLAKELEESIVRKSMRYL